MSVSGALFDMAKLTDVSKTVISKMTAQEVFDLAHAWADRHQPNWPRCLTAIRLRGGSA